MEKVRKFESPSEKSERYAVELSMKQSCIDNSALTGNQASYRMGYLNARRDASRARKAWNKKHK